MGWKAGLPCLLLDALKGFLPVVAALSLARIAGRDGTLEVGLLRAWSLEVPADHAFQAQLLHVATGLMAILGHNYSPWVGFKGGKGIATSAGVLLALFPFFGVLLLLVVWALLFLTTRYVSVASMGAALSLPLLTHLGARFHHVGNDPAAPTLWQAGTWNKPLFALTVAIAVMAVWKHRGNIRRLVDGTENRFSRK